MKIGFRIPKPSVRGVPFLVAWLAVLIELGSILALNHGRFVYSLDDPYIHLSLAERMAHGHYGINVDEPASPSSSALWPFVLALFGRSKVMEFVPLVINVALLFLSVTIVESLLWRSLAELERRTRALASVSGACLIMLLANQVGLVFTGLEHSLSALAALAVLAGLLWERDTGRMPLWALAALALGPAVRYENLAISVPALVYLAVRGQYLRALGASLLMLAPLAAFSMYLQGQGLEWLPTAVLARAPSFAGSEHAAALVANLQQNFARPHAWIFLAACAFVAAGLRGARARGVHPGICSVLLVAAALHLALGRFGFFGRYEAYLLGVLLALAGVLHAPALVRLGRAQPLAAAALAIVACALFFPQTGATLLTPLAANNIYEQDYQMHRFRQAMQPVRAAVRELGFAAFHSPEDYTLDLSGVASPEVLQILRTPDKPAGWLDGLFQQKEIELVMVPAPWGEQHAGSNWVKIASLSLTRKRITPSADTVTFYAIGEGQAERARKALGNFQPGLPPEIPPPSPELLPTPDPNAPVGVDPNAPAADPNAPTTPPVGARKLPSLSAVSHRDEP